MMKKENFELHMKDLDLEQIAQSGQCFRMRCLEEDVWAVSAGDHYVQIRQRGEVFTFSCDEEIFHTVWENYFDLNTDYGEIKKLVDPNDPYLSAATAFGCGIRILRQNPWEMIMTFLISQNNNIGRITGSVDALCRKYGKRRRAGRIFCADKSLEDGDYYAFPAPEAVAAEGISGLKDLGLGYRDKYLTAMADRCSGDDGRAWLRTLALADYETALGMLKEEFGVGQKVADCICLFGLHHVEAFPIDTHIRQILSLHYPDGFPYQRYHGVAGIIQQYLFYYKLHGGSVS